MSENLKISSPRTKIRLDCKIINCKPSNIQTYGKICGIVEYRLLMNIYHGLLPGNNFFCVKLSVHRPLIEKTFLLLKGSYRSMATCDSLYSR